MPTLADIQAATPRCQHTKLRRLTAGPTIPQRVPCYGLLRYRHIGNAWYCPSCERETKGNLVVVARTAALREAA
jgi:hypothetical protein